MLGGLNGRWGGVRVSVENEGLPSALVFRMEFLLVPCEIGSLCKPLLAILACMRSLIAVDCIAMGKEVILLSKGLVALATFVGTNLLMNSSDMLIEMTLLRKADGTLITLKRTGSTIMMLVAMGCEIGGGRILGMTVGTGITLG